MLFPLSCEFCRKQSKKNQLTQYREGHLKDLEKENSDAIRKCHYEEYE
jgi:hypothetical protein